MIYLKRLLLSFLIATGFIVATVLLFLWGIHHYAVSPLPPIQFQVHYWRMVPAIGIMTLAVYFLLTVTEVPSRKWKYTYK